MKPEEYLVESKKLENEQVIIKKGVKSKMNVSEQLQQFYTEIQYLVAVKYRTTLLDSIDAEKEYYNSIISDINELGERLSTYSIEDKKLNDNENEAFLQWLKIQLIGEIENCRKNIMKSYSRFLKSTYSTVVPNKKAKKENIREKEDVSEE